MSTNEPTPADNGVDPDVPDPDEPGISADERQRRLDQRQNQQNT